MSKRFQEEFIKYVFTSIIINTEERPLCAIHSEFLASWPFKAKKLIQRGSQIDCDVNIFLGKAEIVNKTRLGSSGSNLKKNIAAVEILCLVAHTTAIAKMLYTTAVQYIWPWAMT
jgi:hypothetical protein